MVVYEVPPVVSTISDTVAVLCPVPLYDAEARRDVPTGLLSNMTILGCSLSRRIAELGPTAVPIPQESTHKHEISERVCTDF